MVRKELNDKRKTFLHSFISLTSSYYYLFLYLIDKVDIFRRSEEAGSVVVSGEGVNVIAMII